MPRSTRQGEQYPVAGVLEKEFRPFLPDRPYYEGLRECGGELANGRRRRYPDGGESDGLRE